MRFLPDRSLTRLTLIALLVTALGSASTVWAQSAVTKDDCPAFLNVDVRKLHSKKSANLCDYYQPGKPLLIVNTASHCGFTKQFGGLESLYQAHKGEGLTILGFPSNSFKQEEAEEAATARICYQNYGVTFPMFEHVSVRGDDAHSVFKYLANQTEAPSWNFNKYLLSNGKVYHYGSRVDPQDDELEKQLRLSF